MPKLYTIGLLCKKSKMSVIENLNWRYATKTFSDKKISSSDLEKILEAWRLTASWSNTQPRKFVVVEDKKLLQKLAPAAYNQPQITSCDKLIVLCSIKNYDENYVSEIIKNSSEMTWASEQDLDWYRSMLENMISSQEKWLKHNVFIALWSMMLQASELKIDNCPMWGFDNKKFDEILNLEKENCESVVLLALGYRDENDQNAKRKKVRFNLEKIVVRK